jgi:hypothetical protein
MSIGLLVVSCNKTDSPGFVGPVECMLANANVYYFCNMYLQVNYKSVRDVKLILIISWLN